MSLSKLLRRRPSVAGARLFSTSAADYVVVGAGTSGCAVARRLADAGASVTLLEAGRRLEPGSAMHEMVHDPMQCQPSHPHPLLPPHTAPLPQPRPQQAP